MNSLHQTIESYVQGRLGEALALLEALVRLESPTARPETQQPVLNLLADHLEAAGYRTTFLPGKARSGGHLYARPRDRFARRMQLVVGHCDTVWPIGTLADMPFEVADNAVRGPGVFDMKGGLVQGVLAVKALHDLGIQPDLAPVFFVNSDEEIGSPESSRHLRRLARAAVRAFVLEPALGHSGKLKTARKGGGRFTVRIEGRSAHAGLDMNQGASAILELSHVIQKLHGLNDPDRGITVNVGHIEGGIQPNVVAPASKAVADIRVERATDAVYVEEALKAIRATTPGTSVRIEGRFGRPPMERTDRNQALWLAAVRTAEAGGLELEEGLAGGASDGNILSQFTATLDGLGAVGDGAHARHEFLYLDKMVERAALLAVLLTLPADAAEAPSLFAPAAGFIAENRP